MPQRANKPETTSPSGTHGVTKLPDREIAFLTKMMEREMRGDDSGVSYETLRVELNIGQRVKSQMAAWKNLKNLEYIVPTDGSNFRLTQKGIDLVASPEYKEYIKDLNIVSATNEDHQARIKKHLNPEHKKRGIQIFDLLLEYGSFTAMELAALAKIKRGAHHFSYALQELKKKGYVETDDSSPEREVRGKLLCLSDKAFLSPADRPKTFKAIDPEFLANEVKMNAERKRGGPGKLDNEKTKKVKKEDDKVKKVNEEGDAGAGDSLDMSVSGSFVEQEMEFAATETE